MAHVDVVVVSYNSRRHLRDCVRSLTSVTEVEVIVVDNASADGTLDTISDLPLTLIRRTDNGGFAAGCNDGWRAGKSGCVLFLNPDARIDEPSVNALVGALQRDPSLGAVAPRIHRPDGTLAWSQRRFPRLCSTYSRAFFLHRMFPRATWTDEMVRDESAYGVPGSPDWLSGACLLVRRSALEEIGGWDDGFFLYGEDIDLCRRLRNRGYELRYEPTAVVHHLEGASSPGYETLALLARSRIRYGYKHRRRVAATLEQLGVALEAAIRVVASRGGRASRTGYLKALRTSLSRPKHLSRSAGPT